jgi:hypothetical protein
MRVLQQLAHCVVSDSVRYIYFLQVTPQYTRLQAPSECNENSITQLYHGTMLPGEDQPGADQSRPCTRENEDTRRRSKFPKHLVLDGRKCQRHLEDPDGERAK